MTEPRAGGVRRRTLLAVPAVLLVGLGAGRARAADEIDFDGLYADAGVLGMRFSDRARALAGQRVVMHGFMAPPLKAESPMFVLTRAPMALCPFCQSDADWPVDIVVVYLRRAAPLVGAGRRVRVEGRLDLGSWTDPVSGFVSQVRIVEASVE